MTARIPASKRIAFERCLDYLDADVVLLSQPPTGKMRQQGWTEQKLGELRPLVEAWRQDLRRTASSLLGNTG